MRPESRIGVRIAESVVLALLLSTLPAVAQTARQQATEAYQRAQASEVVLKGQPTSERTRSQYLGVIRQYERVYLITPHTGYADDALLNIAALYEDIDDSKDAVLTLRFLIREYPSSRFIGKARNDVERLTAPDVPAEAPPEDRVTELTDRVAERTSTESPADGPVWVENIRYWESQKSVRVVVDMLGEPTVTQGDAQNPPRVFVDIHDARLGASLEQRDFPVSSVMLHNVRVGQYDNDTVRVVLDLVQFHDAAVFTLRNPDRLVIDVLGNSPTRLRVPPPPAVTRAERPETTDLEVAAESLEAVTADQAQPETGPDETVEEAQLIGTPASPAANGDYSQIRSLGLKIGRVVIDPGHGGNDTGTIGPSGLTEKELVLDIALGLKERIENEIGAEVVLTRNGDSFVPLETRTAIANQAEADLFLSIHANSSGIRTIRGFETYVLNLATSSADREIAARENAASQASISELQDLLSQIMLQDKLDESREFATHVQQAMADRQAFGRDRGVKQAPFVVLIGANMPSILAEVSFISNPDDERLLKGEDRRRAIVEALFDGVRSYSDTLSGFTTAQVQE